MTRRIASAKASKNIERMPASVSSLDTSGSSSATIWKITLLLNAYIETNAEIVAAAAIKQTTIAIVTSTLNT